MRFGTDLASQLNLLIDFYGKIKNYAQKSSPTSYGTIQQSITSCRQPATGFDLIESRQEGVKHTQY